MTRYTPDQLAQRAKIEPRAAGYRYGCCWNDAETLFTCVTGATTEVKATDGRTWTGVLPHAAIFQSGASSHGTWAVAYGSWDDDQLYVFGPDSFVQGQIRVAALGPKWGNNTTFIEAAEWGFTVYWINASDIWKYTKTRLSLALGVIGTEMIPVPVELAPPASGWADVVSHEPLWLAGPVVNGTGSYGNMATTAPDGTTHLFRPMTRGRFTSGQADNTVSGLPGTIILDVPTGKILRATNVDSQIGPVLACTPSGRGVTVSPGPEGPYQIQFSEQWTLEPVHSVITPPTPPDPVKPPNPVEPPMNKPGVNITSYDKTLTPTTNWRVVVEDRNNPGVKCVVELLHGDLHVTLDNPAGSDRSGLARPIVIQS
jgi:hypothetical protein